VIRVVIADDQDLVRGGFALILDNEPDIEVVGEAADGIAAVELALQSVPDVVLMDIRMPELDGIAATRRIIAARGEARVLILTTFDSDDYVYEALSAGASGFLLKTAPPARLVEAVRTVHSGEELLAPSITRRLIEEYVAHPRPTADARHAELTEREREVLLLLADGHSNAEIARRLVVSDATVKTHVNHVLSKLQIRDRVQAVIYAYESGLVRPGNRRDPGSP
jgi:DNA-binding NarL/FixJ family response regulator